MIVQLNNLSVSYGEILALDDISLEISGNSVGLLGPNGAGKTTLIRTLLGFLKPDSGSSAVLGMDVIIRQMEIRQMVGYMPEGECYVPGMTAVRYVAYAGQLCGMPYRDAMQRAHEVLQYVGMDEERYRMVETYSAGMKQRIKLAQALVHDPELLFLDEPTSGMDPAGRQDMLDLILDISTAKDIKTIVSSHLLPDIEYACQDVIVLDRGRLLIQGNIEELKDSSHSLFELKVKGDLELFTSRLDNMKIEWRIGNNNILKVSLPENIKPKFFFQIAREDDIQIRHLVATQNTLEDVFAQAVGDSDL
ncbi:ATP-binding cassette domain-containing protein [Candidatus Poribacteria bacterium]|nr:ATP-binding cassette domain-containing protein [Candidatus Poribacteria bacterium]